MCQVHENNLYKMCQVHENNLYKMCQVHENMPFWIKGIFISIFLKSIAKLLEKLKTIFLDSISPSCFCCHYGILKMIFLPNHQSFCGIPRSPWLFFDILFSRFCVNKYVPPWQLRKHKPCHRAVAHRSFFLRMTLKSFFRLHWKKLLKLFCNIS